MRILFWLSIGLDRRTPSEHLLTAMIEALYKRGHTVHILQKDTGGEIEGLYPKLENLGVTTTKIPMTAVAHGNLVSRYLSDLSYVKKCDEWIKQNKNYDRVFLQSSNVAGFQMWVLKKRMKTVRTVFNVQDMFPENAVYSGKIKKNSLPYIFFSRTQKYAYDKAAEIITISEDIKTELESNGVNGSKIKVVYNWSYQDKPFERSLSMDSDIRKLLPQNKFNVVYAGNIGIMQNVEVVIEAARKSEDPDVLFHIFGDGAYKQKLIEKASDLNNVDFWPMQPVDKAPALYACADVNIIPLAQNIYRTALPSKTATCMAVYTPLILCIGTESLFAQRAKRETNCPIVDCSDDKGLRRAIEKIKSKEIVCHTEEFFLDNMEMSVNSMVYAKSIEADVTAN